ncbi:TatD family hydrolase [Hamadaea tsunoensis]|uniref:TatD family hydrolase n=1 Tax=Hamadaea tsunoensis TaxID=53368 RepID=UPI00040E59B5|nr:TatD family hydrolase [Hamadaea tsunoensis]
MTNRSSRAALRRERPAPPAPEPLAVPVLDSHVHLDIVGSSGAGWPVAQQIEAARAVGVDRLVQVGVDLDSSEWGAALARTEPAVLATVALHPNEAPRLTDLDGALARIDALADQERVRGVGETGMDTFRTGEDGRKAQEHSFRGHIEIAKRTGKALVIHDREAHAEVLRILDDAGAPDTVVLHCFSGDADFAAECVRRGYVLSFAGTVTFGNAPQLRAAAALTPLTQMLVETDAPYLTPMPHRGAPNGSYLIPLTIRQLAAATGKEVDEVCAGISATGERVFGPW